MKQEEKDLWKSARLSGEKGLLNLDKAEYLLMDILGMLQKKEEVHPELYRLLDLHHLWSGIRNVRMQVRETRKVWEHLKWAMQVLDRHQTDHMPGHEYSVISSVRTVADRSQG